MKAKKFNFFPRAPQLNFDGEDSKVGHNSVAVFVYNINGMRHTAHHYAKPKPQWQRRERENSTKKLRWTIASALHHCYNIVQLSVWSHPNPIDLLVKARYSSLAC